MKVLIPGHCYELETYDAGPVPMELILRFVSRVGEQYPGNTQAFPGTNLQEVFRACIERLRYLDNQIPCYQNKFIVIMLEEAILLLEERAAARHGRVLRRVMPHGIDNDQTCLTCGHIECGGH